MEKETKLKTVEMTRRIRDEHHEQLKDKTWEERVAFYKVQAHALHETLRPPPQLQQKKDEKAA